MIDIGIYGGTFSPPHVGHINAALSFADQIKPQRVYIIPTSIPPHKQLDDGDRPELRFEMVQKAFNGKNDVFEVSDYETRQNSRCYTADTLAHFRKIYPAYDYRLTFLCGTDMFLTLDRWYHSERIFELARIAFMRRENVHENDMLINEKIALYREKFNADIIEIKGRTIEVSSTDIRADIASGGDGLGLIPKEILDYIHCKKLYMRQPSDIL